MRIAALVLLVLAAFETRPTYVLHDQAPERRVVRVKAERFAFTPSEITVAPGEEIEIRLKSDDTSHGFKVAGTDINVTVPKRGKGEVSVTFKADAPGTFAFECSHMCGAGHAFMRGEIRVKAKK
jgi:cytochrome c oxidase subunit 2